MITTARALFSGSLTGAALCTACLADGPPLAWNRLYNTSAECQPSPGFARNEPLPPLNPGVFLNNPRGTGIDDPWRPPHVWPQTRYPVVPAYARPCYGYFETSWRTLPVCSCGPMLQPSQMLAPNPPIPPIAPVRPPVTAPPPMSNGTPATPPIPSPPANEPGPAAPRNPVSAPAVRPTPGPAPGMSPPPQVAPPQAVPPDTGPPKATPPKLERRPKEVAPAPGPVNKQGAIPYEPPTQSATAEPGLEEQPEIVVRPF